MFANPAAVSDPSDLLNIPGLPVLESESSFRIVTQNVQMDISRDGTVDVSSLTVYRNQGAQIPAKILIPGSADPQLIPGSFTIDWDKTRITSSYTSIDSVRGSAAMAKVTLGNQATHSLSVHYSFNLSRVGYGKDQYYFQFRLTGSKPVELFSMSYRYSSGTTFGLPTVNPNLGWEVGDQGASIRKENFVPGGRVSRIRFYANSMSPLGKG